ncbi:Nuclear control of ATPase protein 2 [Thelotrema lepadinum]|nr:Nuclear control of ATPase protein 2 [Thelotrema lepadinum]
MSFAFDQVRRIDAQLDQLQFSTNFSSTSSPVLRHANIDSTDIQRVEQAEGTVDRIRKIQNVIKDLSTSASSQTNTVSSTVESSLKNALAEFKKSDRESVKPYESNLEWCAVGKAAAQTYGLVLSSLLDDILPLSNDIWYWDEVLGSYTYSSLYTVQISPLRLFAWSKDIYQDAKDRFRDLTGGEDPQLYQSVTARWHRFYGIVKESIHDRSIANLQSKFMSPLTEARAEARHNQNNLKKLRDLNASALGILVDEGFSLETDDSGTLLESAWKQSLSKSVLLMNAVLERLAASPDLSVHDVEEQSFNQVDDYVDSEGSDWSQAPALAQNLLEIVSKRVPAHRMTMSQNIARYGKPPRLIRYWVPAIALLLSSGTIARIFFRRKDAIQAWVQDLGTTTKDFWYNWVVEPIKNLIGTIRHDEESEIALMSKESLQGDRASLERMVVDFAVDNPDISGGRQLSEHQIADVRSKVREGDLTPVLKAYEKDLRKPFRGALHGELVRALLIQIQKTKVDVEVAIGGIDALLKSQELVFGFIGLTPSLLLCFGVSRWLVQAFGKGGRVKARRRGRMSRVLRNIDRVLTLSRPTPNHTIPYKDRGLLLYEIHMLRQLGQATLPGDIKRDFLEDLNDLVESRSGVSGQLRILERIQRAYEKYIQ